MTTSSLFTNINNRRVATNGIYLNIAEQQPAKANGQLIVLLHGFPESWYSWRHQFAPLAAAGYHVIAPDMRGYGDSDRPQDIQSYNQVEVTRDIIGLIEALGLRNGHSDWPRLGCAHCLELRTELPHGGECCGCSVGAVFSSSRDAALGYAEDHLQR
jgi:pimeloyl-ACP methyl ester carboxylesterase